MSSNQKGFGAPHLLIVLVVVGVIGFAGWRVFNNQNDVNNQTSNTKQQQQDDVPAVNSATDLKEVEDYLNSQDIDKELDTSELDNALAQ